MEASQAVQASPDVRERSSLAPEDGLEQIEHFQKEVHSSNISDSAQVVQNDVKPAKKRAQLETTHQTKQNSGLPCL